MLTALLMVFLLRGQNAPAFDPATTIAGTVVDATTNAPLGKVLVRLTPVSAVQNRRINYELPPNRSAITEADGRFAFLNVPPGKYHLSAALPNRNPQPFLGDGQSDYSTAIVTGAGVDTSQLTFAYQSGGSITGIISDAGGDPIANAQVHLYTNRIVDGQARISKAQQAQARNHGEFHFSHLVPGTYWIAVAAQPWFASRVGGNVSAEMDMGYPLTYYGDTSDFSAATPITVSEKSSTNVQITLRAVHNIHIQQPAQNGGAPPPLMLQPIGPDGNPVFSPFFRNDPGIARVPPGKYMVQDMHPGNRRGPMPGGASGRIVNLTADGTLDPEKPASIKVSGVVTIEGDSKPQNPVMIQLLQNDRPVAFSRTDKDNTFDLNTPTLTPGRYRVAEVGTPAFYLKTITAKGAEVTGDEVELAANRNVQLSLTIAPFGNSSLKGVVVRDGKPQPGALVLLLPTQANVSHIIRRDQSDLDGSFELSGIPSGQFRLLAIDNGRDLAYRDPAAIAPYLPAATILNINGQPPTTQLKVEVQTRQRN